MAYYSVSLACSCGWLGPFLWVAPRCPAVVRGVVGGYQADDQGRPVAMDVRVAEVLRGDLADSAIRLWGGEGLLCRPEVNQFPVGTEWIFALDGPGSKPGMTPGHALSNCGAFWLRVEGGQVVGNISEAESEAAVQRMPLDEFRRQLAATAGSPTDQWTRFAGELKAGERFERVFGGRLRFLLEPDPEGWVIVVREADRDEDLSRLTPPLHGPMNPRLIEGSQFSPAAGADSNAPGRVRDFIFSPEVGLAIDGPRAGRAPTIADIDAVRRYGRGRLIIRELRLGRRNPGDSPFIEWMRFEADLAWQAN